MLAKSGDNGIMDSNLVSMMPYSKEPATLIEALRPFMADDNHMGTYIVLRVAGLDQGTALRAVRRKYRTMIKWRTADSNFRRLENTVPELALKFGGEARVIRTALLDISIIEAGIGVFHKILTEQPITSDMWTYATKLAGLRLPMMRAIQESESPWERLANSIKHTLAQRELSISKMERDGTQHTITAKEIVVQPSHEQRQIASEIVNQVLLKRNVGMNDIDDDDDNDDNNGVGINTNEKRNR